MRVHTQRESCPNPEKPSQNRFGVSHALFLVTATYEQCHSYVYTPRAHTRTPLVTPL